MRVLVAGATGVIGRPLVKQLREAGHEVVGTTRSPERAEMVRDLGAEPVVVDARDTDALRGVVIEARPEVVINQLTDLPAKLDYKRAEQTFGPTTELRGRAGPALAGAAAEAGARRLIVQSVCFFYASTGKPVHSEDDPLIDLPPEMPAAQGALALETLERSTIETPGIEGVVLRYGFFYGPGSAYAGDGAWAADVRRRRLPIVGKGTGIFSFIHMDDAVSATILALDRGAGIYNVCDDDPAPMSEWLPTYAEALGAKRPRRVPVWLASLVGGKQAALMSTQLEGASNEKAKRELGWQPRYESWRRGFREGLG
jgi:nucleoside-diphosphate-sugar epimerase